MNTLELLEGKYMSILTDMNVRVTLQIGKAVDDSYDKDITESTRENDYWPDTVRHIRYTLKFTNGSSKQYSSLDEIDLLSPEEEKEHLKPSGNEDLIKYEAVNQTKSLSELANVIKSFGNEDGMISGRTRDFDAERMGDFCINLHMHNDPAVLTRNWGIRQQAIMLR